MAARQSWITGTTSFRAEVIVAVLTTHVLHFLGRRGFEAGKEYEEARTRAVTTV